MEAMIALANRSVAAGRTSTILRSLKVPFRQAKGFWEPNAEQLEYIYQDFLKASKQRKRELHPDLNGNLGEFQSFSAACDMVKRQFEQRLPMNAKAIQLRVEELAQKEERRRVFTKEKRRLWH